MRAIGLLAYCVQDTVHRPDHEGQPIVPNADTDRLIALVEETTGYRVILGTAEHATGDAEMISAAPSHPVHVINVSARSLAVADYITAVQCAMLLAMWSHPLGVAQFSAVPEKVAQAVQKAATWRGLSRYPSSVSERTAQALVTGLLHQLVSTPSELIAIEYCHRECPSLRKQQSDAVNVCLRRNMQSLKAEIKDLAPPDIYEKNQIMCAVLARHWCDLSGTEVAMLPYKSIGVDGKALTLMEQYRNSVGSLGERCQSTVDKWADELGLRSLYAWTFRAK